MDKYFARKRGGPPPGLNAFEETRLESIVRSALEVLDVSRGLSTDVPAMLGEYDGVEVLTSTLAPTLALIRENRTVLRTLIGQHSETPDVDLTQSGVSDTIYNVTRAIMDGMLDIVSNVEREEEKQENARFKLKQVHY